MTDNDDVQYNQFLWQHHHSSLEHGPRSTADHWMHPMGHGSSKTIMCCHDISTHTHRELCSDTGCVPFCIRPFVVVSLVLQGLPHEKEAHGPSGAPGQAREGWTQARCVHLQDFLMEHEVWSLLRAPSTVIIHRPNSCLVRVSRTCFMHRGVFEYADARAAHVHGHVNLL